MRWEGPCALAGAAPGGACASAALFVDGQREGALRPSAWSASCIQRRGFLSRGDGAALRCSAVRLGPPTKRPGVVSVLLSDCPA